MTVKMSLDYNSSKTIVQVACIVLNVSNVHFLNLVTTRDDFLCSSYTLYCQKFWDACLYMLMNFNDIPFLIRRV